MSESTARWIIFALLETAGLGSFALGLYSAATGDVVRHVAGVWVGFSGGLCVMCGIVVVFSLRRPTTKGDGGIPNHNTVTRGTVHAGGKTPKTPPPPARDFRKGWVRAGGVTPSRPPGDKRHD